MGNEESLTWRQHIRIAALSAAVEFSPEGSTPEDAIETAEKFVEYIGWGVGDPQEDAVENDDDDQSY